MAWNDRRDGHRRNRTAGSLRVRPRLRRGVHRRGARYREVGGPLPPALDDP
jgi:hypothetical protein